MLKYLKNVSINVDWFLHSPENNTLVVSSAGGVVQPFQLKPGNIYKLPKLDGELKCGKMYGVISPVCGKIYGKC